MAFRPEWYKDQPRRRSFGGMADWSAVRLILTLTFGVFVLQFLVARTTGSDLLATWLGLRSWWPDPAGGTGGFNLLFPVQLVSYMLVHSLGSGIWHIGGNMLFLFFFGRELEAQLGKAGLLRLYLTGGIVGGLAMWVTGLVVGHTVPTIGASGAVYAVMVLYALRWPRRTILILFPFPIPVPVILMVGFKIAMDLNGLILGGSATAYLAHLGGAVVGWLWFRQGDVVGRLQQKARQVKQEKVAAADSDDRREMDRILRKIQAEGLTSLSTSERTFLERRSRELKQRGR